MKEFSLLQSHTFCIRHRLHCTKTSIRLLASICVNTSGLDEQLNNMPKLILMEMSHEAVG